MNQFQSDASQSAWMDAAGCWDESEDGTQFVTRSQVSCWRRNDPQFSTICDALRDSFNERLYAEVCQRAADGDRSAMSLWFRSLHGPARSVEINPRSLRQHALPAHVSLAMLSAGLDAMKAAPDLDEDKS